MSIYNVKAFLRKYPIVIQEHGFNSTEEFLHCFLAFCEKNKDTDFAKEQQWKEEVLRILKDLNERIEKLEEPK